jgi:hypothetical protein
MAPRLGVQGGQNGGMEKAYDFEPALTRGIEPAGGPDVELATLADVAKFARSHAAWRQAYPH